MHKQNLSFDEIVALNHPPELEEEGETAPVVQAAPVVAEPAKVEEVAPAATEKTADVVEEIPPVVQTAAETPPHDRKIVKAARAAERAALKRAELAEAESERLRALVPKAPALALDPKIKAELENEAPDAAKYIAALEAERAELLKRTPAPAKVEQAFVPDSFDDQELQEAIDSVEDLATWQYSAEHQADWTRAKQIDTMLADSPKWKGKPTTDRLAEVVRMRKDELEEKTPPKKLPTAAEAKAKIEEVATTAPVSVADVRGKSPPTNLTSKRADWATKSNEELLAELPED